MTKRIPNLDTFSSLIDRLIIEVGKVSILENKKREENQKKNPDNDKIAQWDHASREANECRAALKARIDSQLKELIEKGTYDYLGEARTF
jgi:hypothetical protein